MRPKSIILENEVEREQTNVEWMRANVWDNSWITPQIADDINGRLDKNFRPVIMLETNKYDTAIFSLFSKKADTLRKKHNLEIFIKSTYYKDTKYDKMIIFIGGSDQDKYFDAISQSDIGNLVQKINNACSLSRLFIVDNHLQLLNFQSITVEKIKLIKGTQTEKAVATTEQQEVMEHYALKQQTKNEAVVEEEAVVQEVVATPTATVNVINKPKPKSWAEIRANRGTFSRNLGKNEARQIERKPIDSSPGYVKRFRYLIKTYDCGYGTLLLPAQQTANSMASTCLDYAKQSQDAMPVKMDSCSAQNAEPKTSTRLRKPTYDTKRKMATMTPEELNAYNRRLEKQREYQRRYRENKKQKEQQYLATLPIDEREAYIEKKEEERIAKVREYYTNAKKNLEERKKDFTPEEWEEYYARKEAKRARDRERERTKSKCSREQNDKNLHNASKLEEEAYQTK